MEGYDLAGLISTLILYIIGFLINGSLVYIISIRRDKCFAKPSDWGSFIICLSCFLWSLIFILIFSYMLATGLNVYSSFTLCQISGFTAAIMAGNSICGNFCLALDRYNVIIHERELSKPRFLIYFVLVEIFIIAESFYAILGPSSSVHFAPFELETYCFFNLKLDNIWLSAAVMGYLFLVCTVISSVYLQIYLKVRKFNLKMKEMQNISDSRLQVSSSSVPRSTLDSNGGGGGSGGSATSLFDLERTVFYRCFGLAASFILCYSGFFLLCFYRAAWQQSVPKPLEYLSSLAATLDVVISPILIYRYSPKLQAFFYTLVWPASMDKCYISWMVGNSQQQRN